MKRQVVEERKFSDIRLAKEHVAEFRYRPVKCDRDSRIVAVWKDLEVPKGRRKLVDDARCFFYVSNDFRKSPGAIVYEANHRCNQEKLLAQIKGDAHSLSAAVDTLPSTWASMVTAALARSLKDRMTLTVPEGGCDAEERRTEKYKPSRTEFTTFRRAFMSLPAQIISTGTRIVFRLLSWNPWQHAFFRLLDQLRTPLRC